MAILNFPNTGLVANVTQYTGDNGTTYLWDGIKWVGRTAGGAAGTNSIQNSSYTVQVDVVGNLVTPSFTLPNSAGTTGQVLKWPSSGTTLAWSADNNSGGGGSGDRLTNGDYQVVLGSSGNITIPKNKEITLPASTDEDRYGGDISITGQRGYGNWSTTGNAGFGSSIYIRSGDGGENNVSDQGGEGGEVWIRSGDGQAGNNGGTASLIAGNAKFNNSGSAIYGGNVRITAGNANEDASGFGRGGNININAGEGDQSDGSVNINTVGGDFTWTFDPEGVLTIPSSGDIKRSGVSVLGGGATSYAPDDTDNWNEPTINTITAALDELAARVTALQNFEIDGGNANTPELGELLIDGNGA